MKDARQPERLELLTVACRFTSRSHHLLL
jgi:hypothetical protein